MSDSSFCVKPDIRLSGNLEDVARPNYHHVLLLSVAPLREKKIVAQLNSQAVRRVGKKKGLQWYAQRTLLGYRTFMATRHSRGRGGYALVCFGVRPPSPLCLVVGTRGGASRCRLGLVSTIESRLKNTYVVCIIDAWILNSTLGKPLPTCAIIAWPSARRKPACSTP